MNKEKSVWQIARQIQEDGLGHIIRYYTESINKDQKCPECDYVIKKRDPALTIAGLANAYSINERYGISKEKAIVATYIVIRRSIRDGEGNEIEEKRDHLRQEWGKIKTTLRQAS